MATQAVELLKSPETRKDNGQAARRAVSQRFTVERLLGDMDDLYRELLRAKAIHVSEADRVKVREYNESRTF
jgi:glycosyltransferase involved in cell wall biosynthesis